MIKLKEIISKFLLKFSFIRFLRSFYYGRINPYLKFCYYLTLLGTIISIPYFILQNKDYLLVFKNRFINEYIEFIDEDEDFYSKVIIKGNKYTDYDILSKIVRDEINNFSANKNNYLDSIIKSIKNKIEALPWIKNVIISRNLPSDLIIKIQEYEPFAIWQNANKKYIIDKNGKIVTQVSDVAQFSDLLILSGKKANLNANSLFNILAADLDISQNIYSATWVGSRRWNMMFNNDLLVKFPEEDMQKAWKILVKIYNTPGSLIDLKAIDLRISNKIYLEYDDNSIKDLKSL